MRLGIKVGIVTAASAALIGGAAFAAPSFAVESSESPQTQSQEMRQLHKADRSGERQADCDGQHSEADNAAHKAQGQGKRMGMAKGQGPVANS